MKTYYIGTDEAGYGPNLGPLVVSASFWKIEFSQNGEDAVEYLNSRVSAVLEKDGSFGIDDSKKLYSSGRLSPLERSFFFGLGLADLQEESFSLPLFQNYSAESLLGSSWKEIVDRLAVSPESEKKFVPPWERDSFFPVPLTSDRGWQTEFPENLQRVFLALNAEQAALCGLKSRRVQPEEFNLLLEKKGLKSELLADITFETALSFLNPLISREPGKEDSGHIRLLCDKLGGRNSYGDLLERFFPTFSFSIEDEKREQSSYSLQVNGWTVHISFKAKGESNIPTAMASIASKYLREISMKAFNLFWQEKIPDIKPTAGYPLDARRFRDETDLFRRNTALDDILFWRNK